MNVAEIMLRKSLGMQVTAQNNLKSLMSNCFPKYY
jgi:hypothetical protein